MTETAPRKRRTGNERYKDQLRKRLDLYAKSIKSLGAHVVSRPGSLNETTAASLAAYVRNTADTIAKKIEASAEQSDVPSFDLENEAA